MFIPDEGMVFIGADLSQAENRVVAYVSGDKKMIEVVESEGDIHTNNAAMIFDKDPEDITYEERQLGKRITHGVNYQMGAITLARYAKVSTREARKHLRKYKQTYPKVEWWHKEIEKKIRMDRTLTNPFGRRRVFYDRMGGDLFRDATAFIPQSSVADAIHRATRYIYARLPHPARIVLQLHDALTVQAPENMQEKCKNIMVEELEQPFEIDGKEIVIPTDPEIGYNWEEVS
jgi:DNA polymerase-1